MKRERDKESERQKNREAMPETAAFMDIVAKYDKPTYGRFVENGKTVEWGKKGGRE